MFQPNFANVFHYSRAFADCARGLVLLLPAHKFSWTKLYMFVIEMNIFITHKSPI